MRETFHIVRSVVLWIIIVITLVLFFIPASVVWLLTVPFDRRRVVFHFITCLWGAFYLRLPGWTITVSGRSNFRKKQVYIIICNHQSLVDIAAVFYLFRHFKWVSKIENYRLPVVGWVMRMNRYISVDRSSRTSIIKMMDVSEKHLRQGSSVLLFPEGTRSRDRNIGTFKDGAFTLSMKTGIPVLPLYLEMPGDLIRRGFIFEGRKHIRLTVMPELSPGHFSGVEQFRDVTRSLYLAGFVKNN